MQPFLKRWVVACSLGEFLGIGFAAAIAIAHIGLIGEPVNPLEKLSLLLFMMAAGAIEGSLIATSQWWVLKEKVSSLKFKKWWRNTVIIAVSGWVLGMLPSLLMADQPAQPAGQVSPPPSAFILLASIPMGLLLGTIFGWGQWLELRKHIAQSKSWIKWNALGWGFGMLCIFIAATWPNEQTPIGIIILSATMGGALAGLSVGLATAISLNKLLGKKPKPDSQG